MPYIKAERRQDFKQSIETTLGILKDPNDNFYLKGEFIGYFINRLVRRFLSSPDYTNSAFNSSFFNESKRKSLDNAADSIAALLNRADPISAAGELNYSISAIYWGFLGQCEGFGNANYGSRAYLNGIIDKILSQVETVNFGSQKDASMAFRRHLVIRGVLDHIKHETYSRLTTLYEKDKLEENGDVWKDGKIVS